MRSSSGASQPVAAVVDGLNELRDVVAGLSPGVYSSEDVLGGRGSIGRHVRHCCEHARLLVDGLPCGAVNYDSRVRGTQVETDPGAAVVALDQVCDALAACRADPDQVLTVCSVIDHDGACVETRSTFGRELVFLQSHTVHHAAMIRAILATEGVEVSPGFGFAPATIADARRSES